MEAGEISQGKKDGSSWNFRPFSGRSGGEAQGTPGGHGWFFVDKNDEGNVATGIDFEEQDRFYVSPRAMAVALDGDRVRVRLVKNHGGSREHKDLRARVIEVVERRSSKVTGIFLKKGKFSSVRTEDERLPPTIRVGNTPMRGPAS